MERTRERLKNDDKLVIITERKIEVMHKEGPNGYSKEAITYNLSDILSNNINMEASQLCTITELDLSHCGIQTLPLPKLPSTTVLNLSHNQLAEVPSCLYTNLDNLHTLDLSHNQLKTFDVEPACCLNIETVRINNNRIYNLPDWILTGRCTNLVELNYSHNMLMTVRTNHQNNIKRIEMRNCQLIDIDFDFFKDIKQLEYLDIGNALYERNENNFKNLNDLFVLPQWDCLKVLKLNNLLISVLPAGIFYIASLRELHLVNCELTWISSDVEYLEHLELLDVTGNSLVALPNQLGSLAKLKIIKATCNKISIMPKTFKSKLEMLDMYNNELEEFSGEVLAAVKYVDLELNFFETKESDFYEEYVKKRAAFRENYGFKRSEGIKEVTMSLKTVKSPCSYSIEESEGNRIADVCEATMDEEERWDYPVFEKCDRNPDVTESDDEWDCKEVLNVEQEAMNNETFYLDYESWIFADAD